MDLRMDVFQIPASAGSAPFVARQRRLLAVVLETPEVLMAIIERWATSDLLDGDLGLIPDAERTDYEVLQPAIAQLDVADREAFEVAHHRGHFSESIEAFDSCFRSTYLRHLVKEV
jgi:hypothetical protein